MSDREDSPNDLFDAVCRLDDIADWLEEEAWCPEAADLRLVSATLKGYIQLSLPADPQDDTERSC
jgi:hypothetical protein